MRRSTMMPVSYAALLPPFVRRRTRTSLFCVALLVLIGFTVLHDPASQRSDAESSGGKPFLEVINFPWPQSTRKPPTRPTPGRLTAGGALDDFVPDAEGGGGAVDELPEIPPTLQTDKDGDYNDAYVGGGDALPAHAFRPDGLLVTNPDGAHPIYELVARAEKAWAEKHRRASRTLDEAVEEYERRYRRPPPLGFNHWWDYVQRYDVQLPDEYDQIFDDLEPYWGIEPHQLQEMQREWEGHQDSFTIGKTQAEDVITVMNVSLTQPERMQDFMAYGAKPQLDALAEVHQYIPPFRAVFSPHDNPNIMADWTWRNAARAAAKDGTYIRAEDLPPVQRGWRTMCPPDAPLAADPDPVKIGDAPTPQAEKTFIHDHRLAMDPCQHPQHLLLHGQFLSADVDPIPARFAGPQFSNCVTTLHGDIHATSMAQASARMDDDPVWADKDDDRLFWRGTLTGLWHRPGLNWWQSQRLRLVNATRASTPELETTRNGLTFDPLARVSVLRPTASRATPVGAPAELARRKLNSALMDVALVEEPKSCEPDVCAEISAAFKFGAYVPAAAAGKYKYLLDVDGNGWSARFRRLMSSHSLVFKASVYPEWWLQRAQPWVHYVPVQLDYSDLSDSLVFFAGDMSGEGAHEDMARKIAEAGREWVHKYWREEDVTAYMFRLWLEYARVMSLDRNDMNFYLPSNKKS